MNKLPRPFCLYQMSKAVEIQPIPAVRAGASFYSHVDVTVWFVVFLNGFILLIGVVLHFSFRR